jgi:hypothetical protein
VSEFLTSLNARAILTSATTHGWGLLLATLVEWHLRFYQVNQLGEDMLNASLVCPRVVLERSSTTWIGHVEKVMNMDIFINYV